MKLNGRIERNKKLLRFFMILSLIAISIEARSNDFNENFSFITEPRDKGDFITGWVYNDSCAPDYIVRQMALSVSSLTIPASVVGVVDNVFSDFENITTLHISDSDIPLIGYGAFFIKLEEIYLGRNCTDWSFGGWYSSLCEPRQTLKKLIVGNHVTEIRDMMFSDNALEDVTLGNAVVKIGNSAFSLCKKLPNIEFPETMLRIEDGAFRGCEMIKEIVIPQSTTFIGSEVFNDCINLEKVVFVDSSSELVYKGFRSNRYGNLEDAGIFGNTCLKELYIGRPLIDFDKPDYGGSLLAGESIWPVGSGPRPSSTLIKLVLGGSVTNVVSYMFQDCNMLEDVEFKSPIGEIGDYSFSKCYSLSAIDIPESVNYIGQSAFFLCNSLSKIRIPDSVTYLGNSAFSGCMDAESLILGHGINRISDACFNGCSSLAELVIPENINIIERQAFWGCSSLSSVLIPNTVGTIEEMAFSECTNLKSVIIDDGDMTLMMGGPLDYDDDYCLVFYRCPLENLYLGRNLEFIYDYPWILQPTNLKSVQFGDNVTTIPFRFCGGAQLLEDVIFGTSLREINMEAFSGCHSVKEIEFPNSLEMIDENAFRGAGLEKLVFNDGLRNIGNSAFSGSDCLREINFSESIESIGDGAFEYIQSNAKIYTKWINPPSNKYIFGIYDEWKRDELYRMGTLYVPYGTIDVYSSIQPWLNFVNVIEYDPDSSIEDTRSDINMNIIKDNDMIVFSGDLANKLKSIYDMSGVCVYNGSSETIKIKVPGYYILEVGGLYVKIVI